MLEVLSFAFMQRAYLAGIAIAIPCALLGVFLVLRRLSLVGEALAHISFAGLALSYILGVAMLPATLITTALGALGIHRLQRHVRSDAAFGIMYTTLFAFALLLIGMTNRVNVDLFSFLFGNVLAITPGEVAWALILAGVVAAIVLLTYRIQLALALNEETARVSGINADTHNLLLLVLTAVTVVVAAQIVGILLVAAFIIIPASTALRVSRSTKQSLLTSTLVALLAVLVGITAAYYFDLPASATIVLTAAALFGVSLIPPMQRLFERIGTSESRKQ